MIDLLIWRSSYCCTTIFYWDVKFILSHIEDARDTIVPATKDTALPILFSSRFPELQLFTRTIMFDIFPHYSCLNHLWWLHESVRMRTACSRWMNLGVRALSICTYSFAHLPTMRCSASLYYGLDMNPGNSFHHYIYAELSWEDGYTTSSRRCRYTKACMEASMYLPQDGFALIITLAKMASR